MSVRYCFFVTSVVERFERKKEMETIMTQPPNPAQTIRSFRIWLLGIKFVEGERRKRKQTRFHTLLSIAIKCYRISFHSRAHAKKSIAQNQQWPNNRSQHAYPM